MMGVRLLPPAPRRWPHMACLRVAAMAAVLTAVAPTADLAIEDDLWDGFLMNSSTADGSSLVHSLLLNEERLLSDTDDRRVVAFRALLFVPSGSSGRVIGVIGARQAHSAAGARSRQRMITAGVTQ